MEDLAVRRIAPGDDPQIAALIRTVMPEFGASGPGFAIHDAEVDRMYEAYSRPGAAYFVVARGGERILGGAGVARLDGGEPDVCELKKMYFLPELRGRGFGQRLMDLCLEEARRLGYRRIYLETLASMTQARKLYEKNGFRRLAAPMGNTGHFSCDAWYAREV